MWVHYFAFLNNYTLFLELNKTPYEAKLPSSHSYTDKKYVTLHAYKHTGSLQFSTAMDCNIHQSLNSRK